jgi:hypothetical protein
MHAKQKRKTLCSALYLCFCWCHSNVLAQNQRPAIAMAYIHNGKPSPEMKVGLIESIELGVFQGQGIVPAGCTDGVMAALGCMSQNVREMIEYALAELLQVVTSSASAKVFDDVTPEIRCEHKTVVSGELIAGGACQRITAP